MKILYTTGDALWLADGGRPVELPSYRAQQYQATLEQISAGKAWKTTGRGAQFMGVAEAEPSTREVRPAFGGIALYKDEILYSLNLDASGGLYRRDFEERANPEGHIVSGAELRIGEIALHGDDLVACLRYPNGQSHIGIYTLPSSACDEITGGDSVESSPSWSPDGRRILFSTCGIARDVRGMLYSPKSIAEYNIHSQRMDTVLEDEKTDFLAPKEDADGNLWYIRQPYDGGEEKADFGSILLDILLFPVRLLKAVGGFLNAFSVLFGGESLGSNSRQNRGDTRSKQKSDKELFYEDMLIRAEQNQKENQRSGDEYPGILPRSRVLVKRTPDGQEEIIARSVLDYCLCKDGVVYSNGSHILHRTADGKTEEIAKAKLASRMQCVE